MSLTEALLIGAGLPVPAAALYLAALALFARRVMPPPVHEATLRFDIVIPAHNEEQEIGRTVRQLLSIKYPRERFRVLVVADNCADDTAECAETAGASVLVRRDSERRGKGYALAHAFQHCLSDAFADVLVVIDADTIASPNLLEAFATRFAAGAEVVQADYGVRNPKASWRTRLMTIALAAFHGVRSMARERLGLSCGLRGNGMGLSRQLLERCPPAAFSIVEDLEYGIQLGYAGVRVQYVPDAEVLGYMAASEKDSRSQRRRWERGRHNLIRQHVPSLLIEAWRRKDPVLADLAFDLLVPPIGQLTLVSALGLLGSLIATGFQWSLASWIWMAACGAVALHVLKGWRMSGVGLAGLSDLLWAPIYVLWKLKLRVHDRGEAPQEWVRTRR